MNGPRVGEESSEWLPVCAYALTPDSPPCEEQAVTHLMVFDADHGRVSLASCEAHRTIALSAGEPLDEHPYQGFCGFPSTRWMFPPESRCVLDAEEPARAEAAPLIPQLTKENPT